MSIQLSIPTQVRIGHRFRANWENGISESQDRSKKERSILERSQSSDATALARQR
jgi:hypothetical protein